MLLPGIMETSLWQLFTSISFIVLLVFQELDHFVLGNSTPTERCTDRYIKFALHRCNQHLADIGSMILKQEAENFTEVCRCFSDYVRCIEPNTNGCHSILLKPYQLNCDTYTSQPFWCAVPDTSQLPPTELHLRHYNSPKAVLYKELLGNMESAMEWPPDDEQQRTPASLDTLHNRGSSALSWTTGIVVSISVIITKV